MTYKEPIMVLFSGAVSTEVVMQTLIQVRFIVLQIKSIYGLHFFEELKTALAPKVENSLPLT
jgi:hypothetical protein